MGIHTGYDLRFTIDGLVWHGMAWHGMAWRGVVWCGVVWYGQAIAILNPLNYRQKIINTLREEQTSDNPNTDEFPTISLASTVLASIQGLLLHLSDTSRRNVGSKHLVSIVVSHRIASHSISSFAISSHLISSHRIPSHLVFASVFVSCFLKSSINP